MHKILILTSCTSKKKYNPSNQLTIDDFKDKDLLRTREQDLEQYQSKAIDMYKGLQHTNIIDGVNQLRTHDIPVDVAIISAGYGLLLEDDIIVPYEVTFNNMKSTELNEWSEFLNIAQDVNNLIKSYDIMFIMLGNKYLKVLGQLQTNPNQVTYYFENKQDDSKLFSYPLVGLKGYQFKLLSNGICNNMITLDDIYENPQTIKNFLNKFIKR